MTVVINKIKKNYQNTISIILTKITPLYGHHEEEFDYINKYVLTNIKTYIAVHRYVTSA